MPSERRECIFVVQNIEIADVTMSDANTAVKWNLVHLP